LATLLKSEQFKNEEIVKGLDELRIPREVQGIHHTQEEINTLGAILQMRETQWAQIKDIMEIQKEKQKGNNFNSRNQ
jgi:hypothetical protein